MAWAAITESDVLLASSSEGVISVFNVRPSVTLARGRPEAADSHLSVIYQVN